MLQDHKLLRGSGQRQKFSRIIQRQRCCRITDSREAVVRCGDAAGSAELLEVEIIAGSQTAKRQQSVVKMLQGHRQPRGSGQRQKCCRITENREAVI